MVAPSVLNASLFQENLLSPHCPHLLPYPSLSGICLHHSYHLEPLCSYYHSLELKPIFKARSELTPFLKCSLTPCCLNDHGISVYTSLILTLNAFISHSQRSFVPLWIHIMDSLCLIHKYKLCKQSVHKEYQNAFNCMVITLWDAQFQERSYMSLNLDFLLIFWSHQQHPDSEFSVHTFQGGKGTPFWGIQIPYLNNNSNEYLYILSLLSAPPSLTLYPWLT